MCPDLRAKAASVSIVTLYNNNNDDDDDDNNNNNNNNKNNNNDNDNVSNFPCKQDPEIRYNPNYFEYHLQYFLIIPLHIMLSPILITFYW